MERNFQEKVFGNLGIGPREVVLSFREFYKFLAIFYSALVLNLVHGELHISRKEDGDAYSKNT